MKLLLAFMLYLLSGAALVLYIHAFPSVPVATATAFDFVVVALVVVFKCATMINLSVQVRRYN